MTGEVQVICIILLWRKEFNRKIRVTEDEYKEDE